MASQGLKLVDRVYWLVRAEDHLDLASRASDERAAHAHAYLAAFYLDRVHGGELEVSGRPGDDVVSYALPPEVPPRHDRPGCDPKALAATYPD